MPEINDRESGSGGGGGVGSPLTFNKIWKGNANNVAEEAILPASNESSVTLGETINTNLPTLLRVYNDSGTLKAKRPINGFTRKFLALANSSYALTEVASIQVGDSIVFAYRNHLGFPVLQAMDCSTSPPTLGTAVVVQTASSTGISLATDGTNCIIAFETNTVINCYPFLIKNDKITIWNGVTDNQTGAKTEIAAANSGQFMQVNCAAYDATASRFVVLYKTTAAGYYTIATLTLAGNPIVATVNATGARYGGNTTTKMSIWYDAGAGCIVMYTLEVGPSGFRKITINPGSPDIITVPERSTHQTGSISAAVGTPAFIYANSESLAFYIDIVPSSFQRVCKVARIVSTGAAPVATELFTLEAGGCDSIAVTYNTRTDGWEVCIFNINSLSYRLYFIQKIDDTKYSIHRPVNIAYNGALAVTKPMDIIYDAVNNKTVGIFKDAGSLTYTGWLIENPYPENTLCDLVLTTAGNVGEVVNVHKLGNTIDGFSGLAFPYNYYWQANGTVGLTKTPFVAGKSLSASEIATAGPADEIWIY